MLLAAFSAPEAEVSSWQVDKSLSKVTFRVSSMGITAVAGHFRDFDLDVRFNASDLGSASVNGVVHVGSIETGNTARDADIRDQFFDAEHFPHMKFRSKPLKNVQAGEATLIGDLTIRDVTRQVAFHIKQLSSACLDGENHMAVRVWTTLSKRDLRDMLGGIAKGIGGLFGFEVQISMELELVQSAT